MLKSFPIQHIHTHTQQLCVPLIQFFTANSQVKLYRTTVLTIMNSGHGEIPLQVEEQVCVCVCVGGGG